MPKVQYLKSKAIVEVSDRYAQMLLDHKRVVLLEEKEEKSTVKTKENKVAAKRETKKKK
jgi:hypothetical protein